MLELEGTNTKRSRVHIDEKPHSMQQSPLVSFKRITFELGPKDTNTLGKEILLGGVGLDNHLVALNLECRCSKINSIIHIYSSIL